MKTLITVLLFVLTVSMAAGQDGIRINPQAGKLGFSEFRFNKIYFGNLMEMDIETGEIEFKAPVDSVAKEFAGWVATYYADILTLDKFLKLWDEYKRECAKDSTLEKFDVYNFRGKEALAPYDPHKIDPYFNSAYRGVREVWIHKQPDPFHFLDRYLRKKAGK